MSVNMNMDRIRRWKCTFCGSKLKRKLDAVTRNGKTVGYSLMCCNCGHIDHFALSSSAIPMYLCGERGEVHKIDITCAISENELDSCKNKKCSYHPKYERTENPPSIVKNTTKNLMVEEQKYQ